MLTLEHSFTFGKHINEQVEDVIGDDPSYLEFLMNNGFEHFAEDVIRVLEEKKII